jgi:hypothetical protein
LRSEMQLMLLCVRKKLPAGCSGVNDCTVLL